MLSEVTGPREIVAAVFKQTVPFALLTALAEILVGFFVVELGDYNMVLPGLLFLLPGIMMVRGNVSSSLAQRLSSALHVGTVGWDLGFNQELKENVFASLFLGFVHCVFLGVFVWLLAGFLALTLMPLGLLLLVAGGTGLLAGALQVSVTVFASFLSAKKGLDPDNVVIPSIAAVGDAVTVNSMILFSLIIVLLGWAA